MHTPSSLHQLKQRAHEVRAALELEFQPVPDAERASRLQRLDQVLSGMDEGLYPVCATCGDRIEMDRLLRDPAEKSCWHCVAHSAGAAR